MTQSGRILDRISEMNPDEDLDLAQVSAVLDELAELNSARKERAIEALAEHGRGKWADGLRGGYGASDDRLFNTYFANDCLTPVLNQDRPDDLDGCRASVLLHLALDLQGFLDSEARKTPTGNVFQAVNFAHREEFQRAARWMILQRIVIAMSAVQNDIEQFSDWVPLFLEGRPANGGRSTYWSFDAEVLPTGILLGFHPSGKPDVLNWGLMTSHVVAASALRSHLESILYQFDFRSSLSGVTELTEEGWRDALKVHADAGDLTEAERTWVTRMYGWLSKCVHRGLSLSYGEVWAMARIVRRIADQLSEAKERAAASAEEESRED